jgi:dTDP-L-rhamnose 4-epimerase
MKETTGMNVAGERTCLVTGGAGFIGCAVSAGLADLFDTVVAVDNLHPQIHPEQSRPDRLDPRVELFVGDVTDAAMWDTLLATHRPHTVVHLAAETGTGQSLTEATRHASVNVVGTTAMMDAFARHGALPSRVVLASSRAVYGEGTWQRADGSRFQPAQRTTGTLESGQWDFPEAEPLAMRADEVPPRPVSVYAATKLAQEHILDVWARSYGVEPVIVRLQNVYGPGQSLINPYTGIMSLFCRMAKEGRSIPLYEDGLVRRDFVAIDDVAAALVAATQVAPAPGEVMDIGAGEYHTIAQAAQIIADLYGAPAPHVTGQFREGDVRHAWADLSAARRLLGYEPAVGLAEGLEQLVSWIDAHLAG